MRKIILGLLSLTLFTGLYAEDIKDFKTLSSLLEQGDSVKVILTFQKGDTPESKVVLGFRTSKFIRYFGPNIFESREEIVLHEQSTFHYDKVDTVYMTVMFYPDDLAKVSVRILHTDKTIELWTFTEKMGDNVKVISEE